MDPGLHFICPKQKWNLGIGYKGVSQDGQYRRDLEFFGGLYGLRRQRLKNRIDEVLDMVGLSDSAKLQYMRYSTGMKKRLSMARALLHDPQVFLLDEPNSGVDPHSAKAIRDIILSLKSAGKTILLTTHDMSEAERLSDEIGYLKDGKLIKVGKVDEFKCLVGRRVFEITFSRQSVPDPKDIDLLATQIKNAVPCDLIERLDNVLRISHNGKFDINHVCQIVNSNKLSMEKINTIEATLEDVFIKLAG